MLLARPELTIGTGSSQTQVYQGSARFRALPSFDAHVLTVRAADPLAQFEDPALQPWQFEIKF